MVKDLADLARLDAAIHHLSPARFLTVLLSFFSPPFRRYRMTTPREPQESDYQIRDNLPRKSFDIDKGYAPVLDERGHFPVSAERFPLPVSIPQCPEPTLLCGTTATTTTATTLPVDVTQGGTLPRDTVRIDAPIFCSHPECHVYETTRLGLTNQNKRPS